MAPSGHMEQEELNIEVDVKKIPTFTGLNEKVQKVVKSSSWWDLYMVDLLQIFIVSSFVPVALMMLKMGGVLPTVIATFILGSFHAIVTNKGGHVACHGALCNGPAALKKIVYVFVLEFIGGYSAFMASYTHVDIHHPYTNIIGLGDSSSWKAPFLGRKLYLFCAPVLMPLITPFVAIQQLMFEVKEYMILLKFLPILFAGIAFHLYVLLVHAGFSSIPTALAYMLIYRAVFSIPYIHVNIFQHIGLPMYSKKSKPPRVYQMASGVLNLPRNPILDVVFGHSLISCHVEHHLFPKLSDNMCLKIKPIVSAYMKENNLCYNEDTYVNRLVDFYKRYEELMVKAPPITHFVGIQ